MVGTRVPEVRTLTGVATAAAVVVTLIANRSGPRITEDSANYLAMAAGWVRDGSFTGVGGDALTIFPPGYPVLVAIGTAVIGDRWMQALPAVCAALTVLCTGAVLRRHVSSRWWFAVGLGAVAMSPALHLVWGSAWSEGPFLAGLAVFLVAVDRLWALPARSEGPGAGDPPTASPLRWAGAAVIAVWMVTSLRYVGIVTVPVLGATVALRSRRWSRRDAIEGGLLAAAALLVPVAIALRNIREDGTAFGPRVPASTALVDLVGGGIDTVLRWLVPGAAAAGGVIALVLVGSIVTDRSSRAALRRTVVELAPVIATGVACVAVIAVSAGVASIDGLDDRLLSPVVVPLVLVVASWLAKVDAAAAAPWSRPVRFAAVAWVALAAIACLNGAFRPQSSLSTSVRGTAPVVAAAARLPEGAAVASNAPELLWTWTELRSVRPMPSSSPIGWVPADPDATGFLRWVRCGGGSATVVWFDLPWRDASIRPEDLQFDLRVESTTELDGGRIYEVSAVGGAEDCPGG